MTPVMLWRLEKDFHETQVCQLKPSKGDSGALQDSLSAAADKE